MDTSDDLEIDISSEHEKAFIKGKTGVPFKTLVKLILQRKVTNLFEKWGDNPIVINSELLTDLASAPQDNAESSQHLILVTFGCGIFTGLFTMVALQLILSIGNIYLDAVKLVYIVACMIGVVALGWTIMRIKQRNKSDKFMEVMEKIAAVVPKK